MSDLRERDFVSEATEYYKSKILEIRDRQDALRKLQVDCDLVDKEKMFEEMIKYRELQDEMRCLQEKMDSINHVMTQCVKRTLQFVGINLPEDQLKYYGVRYAGEEFQLLYAKQYRGF